jgi:protein-tyrosine kinase
MVPAGPVPPNPSELIGSHRMESVLGDLSELADYVLIDTPPCLSYSDPLVLARLVDGVVYVVRAGRQNRAAQHRIRKQLEQVKARVLGIVFNRVALEEVGSTTGYANGHNGRP